MKRLYLLRHAKSSWDDPALADHERPLAKRGRRASKVIAKHLDGQRVEPALVLCSPARRTRETLERIASALGQPEVRFEPELYGASSSELVERLREVPDEVDSVMVIGHNPAVQDLALTLAGGGRDAESMQVKFPTAALATLELEGTWNELGPGRATLIDFVRPRELEG